MIDWFDSYQLWLTLHCPLGKEKGPEGPKSMFDEMAQTARNKLEAVPKPSPGTQCVVVDLAKYKRAKWRK